MGCKRICIVDIGIRKCCMECEKHEECNILCDDLDQYEYMEECPDYVKENEEKYAFNIAVGVVRDWIGVMNSEKKYRQKQMHGRD